MISPTFHFCLLTQPTEGCRPPPFSLLHYLCLFSCYQTQPEVEIVVHTEGEVMGEWWETIQPLITVRERSFRRQLKGKALTTPAQVEELAKLEILWEEGGAVADLSTLFIRPLTTFFRRESVTAQIQPGGLAASNLLIAPEKHPVVGRALEEGHLPEEVDKLFPRQVDLEQLEQLEHLATTAHGAYERFIADREIGESRLLNLCQYNNWEDYLKKLVTPDVIFEYNSTLTRLLRPFLPRPTFDFTAVIPVSIEHTDRLENILATSQYLLDQLYVDHVVVVEYGERPQLLHLLDQRIRYLFVRQQPGEMWNKAKVLNTAMPWIQTETMAIWDADVLLSLAQLRLAVDSLQKPQNAGCIPYGEMFHVKRQFLGDVKRGQLNPRAILSDQSNILFRLSPSTAAGLFMMRTDVFRHLRGLNEQYWGWGCEDDDMMLRTMRLSGGSIIKISGPLLHFAHHRTSGSFPTEKYEPLSRAQRARAAKAPVEELYRYLGISRKIGFYCQEREPRPPSDLDLQWMQALEEGNHAAGNPGYTETD